MTEAAAERSNRWRSWVPIILGVCGLLFGSGLITNWWGWQREDARELRAYRDTHLGPIRALLTENKAIFDDLYALYVIEPWGIQESYFIKVRQDGVNAHRVMKARIDQLVRNNAEIQMHLRRARIKIITPEFRAQADAFLEYVGLYNSRWAAVQQMAETADRASLSALLPPNFPRIERRFPAGFSSALEAELKRVDVDTR